MGKVTDELEITMANMLTVRANRKGYMVLAPDGTVLTQQTDPYDADPETQFQRGKEWAKQYDARGAVGGA